MIRVGQRLNIRIKQPTELEIAATTSTPKVVIPVAVPDSKSYTVQAGDTLWDISRKFEGLTIETIKKLNNLSSNKIQPGQRLIISL
jgi:membrane-bound lytic murein transglycosylase D